MSRTQRENIFAQATFNQQVWKTAQKVMSMYEQGQLKDQRLNRKQLTATPEFRQHLLQPLHHLNPDFQLQILSQVVSKEKTLAEMREKAIEYRQMENIKQAFLSCTKCTSWEDATTSYPLHTKDERLRSFITMSFKTTPDVFRQYCPSAVGTVLQGSQANGNFLAVAEQPVTEVTGQQLQQSIPGFSGAHFALAAIFEVS